MKPIWISLTIFLLASPNVSFSTPTEHITSSRESDSHNLSLSDFEVRQRLNELGGKIDLKYNASVERNIRQYLGRRKRSLSEVIGKSKFYFPIFEHFLQVNNLPDELKFLSIVESALNPSAKSPVGASGLWQFMKGTGLNYGLKVDSYIDERNDPIKSTEAAFKYLSDLYQRYNDWTLALAAYNCGPGRINRAIRRARSMDYWKLRRFLPSETRNYVPAFIAVTYVMSYYQSHGIQPKKLAYQFHDVKTISIFDPSSFYQISKLSEVNLKEIKELNPAYKRKYIPRAKNGNYLTLPVEGMARYKEKIRQAQLKQFYNSNNRNYNEYMSIPLNMIQSTYIVQKGESIDYIAKLLRCKIQDIVEWNKLKLPSVFNGQELTVYFPKAQLNLSEQVEETRVQAIEEVESSKNIVFHNVQEGETLGKISSLYSDVSLSDIIRINELFGEIKLKPGDKLKIKEL